MVIPTLAGVALDLTIRGQNDIEKLREKRKPFERLLNIRSPFDEIVVD